jgi:N-methylhydantoinase B/oxoprolinase/acetone carboxylase alpha subunit
MTTSLISTSQLGEQIGQFLVAAGGRPPIDMDHGDIQLFQLFGELLGTDGTEMNPGDVFVIESPGGGYGKA